MVELKQAIATVAEGENYFSNEILRKIIFNKGSRKNIPSVNFTERETEIIMLICQCFNNDEIAEKLYLSAETVKKHRNNIFEKIGCKNVAGLVIFAIKNNIVDI
jgi:DNA-binding NarL/FixJ family response regulator